MEKMGYIQKIRKTKFEIIRKCHLAWSHHVFKKLAKSKVPRPFQCNICGGKTAAPLVSICDREVPSCPYCASNLRMRSVIHLLSLEMFGESIPLPDFPVSQHIRGLGMSDADVYAEPLTEKFSYLNTYYHKNPKFDITAINAEEPGKFDFVISCDVLEHVRPPTIRAFRNLKTILKAGGAAILTVPYMLLENTWEHFPDLQRFEIIDDGEGRKLVNTMADGEKQEFRELVFHSGPGATIELRIFTKSSIRNELKKSGFGEIEFCKCNEPRYGIIWPLNWSLPIVARG